MKSAVLEAAREYEEKGEKRIPEDNRPGFHLTPRIGWMNDPNGFSYYNGQYHLFYQYHPYNEDWGPMHWGHAVSKDLLHWTYLPAAMAPDQEYDRWGCFSGSAVALPNGQHLLMYTGVTKEDPDDRHSKDVQTQCIAVGDGVNYQKYEGNPVLTGANLPEGASRVDFRDPKVWQEKDGSFRCVVGTRTQEGSGFIVLFSSPDGFHWAYKQTLIENHNRFGRMWECPDFFELDGKHVLITSPQDLMNTRDLEFISGNGTLCVIGTMDENEQFVEENSQCIDYGIDFYAPQSTLLPDGRRVMIGWMQNWDSCSMRMDHTKWFGQMSLPREITIADGKLIQKPVRELEQFHTDTVTYENLILEGRQTLDQVNGRMIDMTLEIDTKAGAETCSEFSLFLAENAQFHTRITFDPKASTVEMDRSYSGVRRACANRRTCRVADRNGKLTMRIIQDRYSLEVFLNDGEQVMTIVIFTDQEADGISFVADGKAKVSVTKSNLKR